MTRLLISTAVAGLLALAGPALAQGRDDHRDDHNRPAPAAAPHPAPAPQAARPEPARSQSDDHRGGRDARPAPAAQNTPSAAPAQPDRRAQQDHRPSAGAQNAPAAQPAPRAAMRDQGPNNAMRGPGPNNSMRGPGPGNNAGRNFTSFHRNFSAPHRFRAPAYSRPHGWYSHRWTYGQILPALFWSENYWLDDYGTFGLEAPPPGTVWVRDGDDALLIDRYSGEIIQVEYSVFY